MKGMITEDQARENLARNLRRTLEKKGIAQKELARECTSKGEKLSAIEAKISRTINAKHMPSPAFLLRMATVLKTKMEKLLQ